jgi:hypothetical protein
MDLVKHPDWIREMLEDVTAHHEVLAGVSDGTQTGVEVCDEVGNGKHRIGKFWEEFVVLVRTPTINQSDGGIRPRREGDMARTEVKTRAFKVRRKAPPGPALPDPTSAHVSLCHSVAILHPPAWPTIIRRLAAVLLPQSR